MVTIEVVITKTVEFKSTLTLLNHEEVKERF